MGKGGFLGNALDASQEEADELDELDFPPDVLTHFPPPTNAFETVRTIEGMSLLYPPPPPDDSDEDEVDDYDYIDEDSFEEDEPDEQDFDFFDYTGSGDEQYDFMMAYNDESNGSSYVPDSDLLETSSHTN